MRGIRARFPSGNHALAAIMLITHAGLDWRIRVAERDCVLMNSLMMSELACVFTGLAGWHGGKLVFDHGVGLIISEKD